MGRLLVTGASGFLGWNLCRLAPNHWEIYGSVHTHGVEKPVRGIPLDLADYEQLKVRFREISPTAVIHAAAIADPNWCQDHPDESSRINVSAAINIAGLCAESDVPLLFTSTDLVFDGRSPPYTESDPVSPVCLYGEQKVAAEEGMRNLFPSTTICRLPLMFGEVGSHGQSCLQVIIGALLRKEPVRLFTDEFRTPTSSRAAVSGLFMGLDRPGDLLHLGGVERLSRYGLGCLLMARLAWSPARLQACQLEDVVMAAPRSPDVSLDSSRAFELGYDARPVAQELKQMNLNGSFEGEEN